MFPHPLKTAKGGPASVWVVQRIGQPAVSQATRQSGLLNSEFTQLLWTRTGQGTSVENRDLSEDEVGAS